MGAPHRIPGWWWERALHALIPNSPRIPSPGPTALDCYLARREDKSDAEATVHAKCHERFSDYPLFLWIMPTPQRYDDAIAMLILAPNCIG